MQWFLYIFLFMANLGIVVLSTDTECPYVSTIGDRRSDKSKLRLVQYNVEWLFIDYYSSMKCPGDGCTWKNQSEAEIHMDHVANVVSALNPDIINFCEVEGCDELSILRDKLDGNYVPYLKKGTDTGTGQNVGMLTRVDPQIDLYRTEQKYNYPVAGTSCVYSGTTGVSKHYITEFKFNDYNVAFIAAHLIAIPDDGPRCAQREAQASILQSVIYGYLMKDYEVIMLGDFNDYDAEVGDINDDKPISMVLDILKGIKGELAGKYELYNIAEEIQQKDRYSDWWDSDNNCNTTSQRDFSMIDHILVSPAIKKNIFNVFIYHGYDEFCGKYDSDHFPVVVDLYI
jgi:exonuclease III